MLGAMRPALLILVSLIPVASWSEPALVLTAQENGTEPQSSFHCVGKIHGYLRLGKSQVGSHELYSRWISPAGKTVAESQVPLTFDPPGRSTAYIWFSFPDRSSLLRGPDPALDTELLTYNGSWRVEVSWDQKPLLQSSLLVRCP